MTDLDALEALLAAATTAAPWEVTALTFPDKFVITGDEEAYAVGTFWSLADADLIAALRNQAPALLAEIAELRQRLDAQTKATYACQHEVNIVRARCASAERLLAQEGEALKAARAELAELRAPTTCGDARHVHIGPYCTPVASEQQVKA